MTAAVWVCYSDTIPYSIRNIRNINCINSYVTVICDGSSWCVVARLLSPTRQPEVILVNLISLMFINVSTSHPLSRFPTGQWQVFNFLFPRACHTISSCMFRIDLGDICVCVCACVRA